jgi:hypothetical protein
MKASMIPARLTALAIGLCSAAPAFAAHFTVGGSPNGNFTITGSVSYWTQSGPTQTVTFYPDWSDVDDPLDAGLPITILPNGNSSNYGQYVCNIVMHGSVVNGTASVTSMSVSGSNSVCFRINTSLSQQNPGFPWRFHAVSDSSYPAMLKGILFYSAGLFQCSNVTAMVNVGGGYATFAEVNGTSGCHVSTIGNAASVSPSLDIVP